MCLKLSSYICLMSFGTFLFLGSLVILFCCFMIRSFMDYLLTSINSGYRWSLYRLITSIALSSHLLCVSHSVSIMFFLCLSFVSTTFLMLPIIGITFTLRFKLIKNVLWSEYFVMIVCACFISIHFYFPHLHRIRSLFVFCWPLLHE